MKKKGGDDEATQGPHQNQFSYFIKGMDLLIKNFDYIFQLSYFVFEYIKSTLLPSFAPPVPFGPSFALSILSSVIMQSKTTQRKRGGE